MTDVATILRGRESQDVRIGAEKSKRTKELEARIAREKELEKMERQTTLQLQLMKKGRARKIRRKGEDSDDEDSIPIYKWAPQRQK